MGTALKIDSPFKTSERDFRQMVLDLGKIMGWAYYFTWNSQHSVAGFPDLVLIRAPEIIVVELKSNKGKVTPAQQKWLDLFRSCGIEAVVWKPDDWDIIVERLKR